MHLFPWQLLAPSPSPHKVGPRGGGTMCMCEYNTLDVLLRVRYINMLLPCSIFDMSQLATKSADDRRDDS